MVHTPGASSIASGFANHALQLLKKVQRGISPVELVYTAHERWPLPPGQRVHTQPTLRISVLDSSFNPPTLAHLALANSPAPLPSPQSASPPGWYDAQMLLLSVRNVDKVMTPGDATFFQRLEMMRLLSRDIRFTDASSTVSGCESLQMSSNVAIAIINEPTFVGKSALLLPFMRSRLATFASSPGGLSGRQDASCLFPSPKLVFLLGSDTLVRLFSPKYYHSEQAMVEMLRNFLSVDQEDCQVVCAYRGDGNIDKALEAGCEFTTSRRIAFVTIGVEERTYSSSEVRAKAAAGDGTWRRLVTEEIADYITKQRIYSGSESE